MFFVFDGEEFGRVSSLGEAVGEAKAAVACYEDQCDPDWPDETDSICYGIVLGGAVMREAGKADDGSPTYKFEVADLWSEATVGAERKAADEVDFESVVEVVGSWGQTMMPAILGVAAKECVAKAVFASPAMMLRFVRPRDADGGSGAAAGGRVVLGLGSVGSGKRCQEPAQKR